MNIQHSANAELLWNAVKIEIEEHGFARLNRDWNHEHPVPPFSRLYYILDGEGLALAGGREMALRPGFLYLLPAGLSLRYACPRAMTQLYFHVSVRTADGYDLFSRCSRPLELPPAADVAQMAADYRSNEYLPRALLQYRVKADACRFIAAAGLEEILLAPPSAFLQAVFAAVRGGLRSGLAIRDIAARLSLSESSLAKRFRREFGMPLGRYIDEMLLQEICRLLAGTEWTIGQIAERLGFCDQFYLTRFFSARRGMPPRDYRARLKNQV